MKQFLVLVFALFFFNAHSQTLQTVNGVHTISYDLENGSVYIYLPEKIVAGKVFSGTVALYPKGASSREQAKHLKKLKTHKINALGKEFLAGTKIFNLNGSSATADISLINAAGKTLGTEQVTFEIKPLLSQNTPLSLPGHIANSVNTSFYGVFDGNLENTRVTANGKPLVVVAESPVQLALRPENLTTTSSKLEITDGTNHYGGQCNSIYYTLKVGPTDLKRGQSTYFDATIHGVGTIEESLSYTVVNVTTAVVSLAGGNSQSFVINPGDGENGNWFHHFDIKSLKTGNFSLTTNLVVPDTPYPGMSSTTGGVISEETSSVTQGNIDCRINNQSFDVTKDECAGLGGTVYDGSYTATVNEAVDTIELSVVNVSTIQDSNEIQLTIDIVGGDIPEMVVSTCKPLDPEIQAAVTFLTTAQESYTVRFTNPTFGSPSAAVIETSLLFSNGNSQTINTEVNFTGNEFYSIAKSDELTKIRSEQRKIISELKAAQVHKNRLVGEQKTTSDSHAKAKKTYETNRTQFWKLWHIDQSLEKVRPVFANSLKVLTDSLKAFKKRTGGVRSRADSLKIEHNLRDAKKAHQDCLDQLKRLQQEQTDLNNEMNVLKEQQKQIHRDIMALFRTTGMDFAGSTRRDKNGKFHYQYGVVTVSGDGWGTFHKGSLPVEISSKVSALEKQMKLVTEKLNTNNERLHNLPAEITSKSTNCDLLAQKVKDAETAKTNNDAITAEDQLWNNKIDAICAKIQALLNRLKIWAAVNDPNLLNQINNVKCDENIWTQINGVINRKKILEKGFEGKLANAFRDMNNAKAALDALDKKILEEEEKIRIAQIALVANQKKEAKAAAIALAKDQEKCLKIMKELGYGATSIADVIDLYEISQDVKNAANEAKAAMDNLKKAIKMGGKYGMDAGEAKKWVEKTQKRLGNISKKLAKLEKYKDLAKTIQAYADRIGKLIGSDGSPTENAEAFGEGLKFMNEALDALADKLPILKVFTAYFTFITESYLAIIKGANGALRKQYEQLLSNVPKELNCDMLMNICRANGDDLAKIKASVFKKYVTDGTYGGLRSDETQAKKIIDKIVEQRMAECCFQRLQAIRAAQ